MSNYAIEETANRGNGTRLVETEAVSQQSSFKANPTIVAIPPKENKATLPTVPPRQRRDDNAELWALLSYSKRRLEERTNTSQATVPTVQETPKPLDMDHEIEDNDDDDDDDDRDEDEDETEVEEEIENIMNTGSVESCSKNDVNDEVPYFLQDNDAYEDPDVAVAARDYAMGILGEVQLSEPEMLRAIEAAEEAAGMGVDEFRSSIWERSKSMFGDIQEKFDSRTDKKERPLSPASTSSMSTTSSAAASAMGFLTPRSGWSILPKNGLFVVKKRSKNGVADSSKKVENMITRWNKAFEQFQETVKKIDNLPVN